MTQSLTKKPLEGSYVGQARRVIVAQRLKEKAADEEHEAKLACARSMNTVQMREFDVTVEGEDYHVQLARPLVQVVSPVKLYVLVKEGEISVDDFLECVKVDETAALELLGDTRVEGLKETQRKGLNLIVTPL